MKKIFTKRFLPSGFRTYHSAKYFSPYIDSSNNLFMERIKVAVEIQGIISHDLVSVLLRMWYISVSRYFEWIWSFFFKHWKITWTSVVWMWKFSSSSLSCSAGLSQNYNTHNVYAVFKLICNGFRSQQANNHFQILGEIPLCLKVMK